MKRLTAFIALSFCISHAHATETIDFDSLSLNQTTLINHANNPINVDLFAKVGGACNAGETATFLTDNGFLIASEKGFSDSFKIINQNTQRPQFAFSTLPEQRRITLTTNVPEVVSLRRTSIFTQYIMNATLLSYWYNDANQIYVHFHPADADIEIINNEIAILTQSGKNVRFSKSLYGSYIEKNSGIMVINTNRYVVVNRSNAITVNDAPVVVSQKSADVIASTPSTGFVIADGSGRVDVRFGAGDVNLDKRKGNVSIRRQQGGVVTIGSDGSIPTLPRFDKEMHLFLLVNGQKYTFWFNVDPSQINNVDANAGSFVLTTDGQFRAVGPSGVVSSVTLEQLFPSA